MRRPSIFVHCLLAGALVLACAATAARAATPQEVDAAIKKAKAFLRSQQKPDGSWEPTDRPDQFGGNSAIATYALLAGGDSPQEEHIKRAVAWLRKADVTGIYALGMRAQVWPFLHMNNDVRAAIVRDAELLLKSADPTGRWAYTTATGPGAFFHNSPTQYGVLGLWACARTGYEVPAKFWQASEQGWWACQNPQDGGWQYLSVPPEADKSTPSMTAAGLASLFIAQEYLRSNDGIKCTGNVTNPRIELGLKWMSDHFDPNWDDGYLLYGIERIGVASGYKYFGNHDWYAAGSDKLVKTQGADGSWAAHGPIPGTSFGIFFLTRGRAPVVMNKLEYAFAAPENNRKPDDKDDAHWNQRPRDVANVVGWMGAEMERDLNWQVVNLKVGARDLLDAPILYMSGDQRLRLSDDDKQKLKSYVEQGGLILGQADCGKADFARSFRQLGNDLFPDYEFRPLPPAHPVFNEQYAASKWKGRIAVEGLSNGVRELMLLIPREDVARSWQIRATSNKQHHFALASNIFLYAVDKSNLRFKGETFVLTPDPKAVAKRTIRLARIRYAGNWNPEPGGWQRLRTHLLNTHRLELQVQPVRFGGAEIASAGRDDKRPAEPSTPHAKDEKVASAAHALKKAGPNSAGAEGASLKGFDVAHLTGTTPFKLDDAARAEIRRFVEAGGTLIVDAAGGSSAFAESADQLLVEMFKDGAAGLASPLNPSHPVFTLPGSKVTKVSYRNFARTQLGRSLRTPRIRAITVNDRPAVFFSKEDLSAGLVGQNVDGIYGYEPESATKIVTHLILFATGEGKAPPATLPAPDPAPAAVPVPAVPPVPAANPAGAKAK